jgi:hypothetical protein
MAKSVVIATKASEDLGAVSRKDNTVRVFVHPADIKQIAVTGTWALEEATNVPSLATDDAGTTNVFDIPLVVPFSDAEIQSGSGTTDRGYKVLGLELIYQVATSALGAFDLSIFKLVPTAVGVVAATEITTTLTPDTAGDDGTEVDTHRMQAVVAERDRLFVDSGTIIIGKVAITDGTSSDVNLNGAIWHLEKVTA